MEIKVANTFQVVYLFVTVTLRDLGIVDLLFNILQISEKEELIDAVGKQLKAAKMAAANVWQSLFHNTSLLPFFLAIGVKQFSTQRNSQNDDRGAQVTRTNLPK